MTRLARTLRLGAFTLLILASACNLPAPTPGGNPLPDEQPAGPTPAVSGVWSGGLPPLTPTLSIPVTGLEPAQLQCQFCMNDEPHAVLLLDESARFNVAEPLARVTCITAQVVNGRRILLCRGAPQTAFQLNVCADGSSCSLFSVTLETCPILPQTGSGTARPTLAAPTATIPAGTATSTRIPRQTPTHTAIPSSTPALLPPQEPTAAPALPTQPAGTSLQDPAGFVRWYFTAIWSQRNYPELWNNYLTSSFRANVGSGRYEDYELWWSSVQRVDIHSVEVMQNDGTHAWVRVNLTFTMADGRVVANQQYDYDLLFDATRQVWMFDYRT